MSDLRLQNPEKASRLETLLTGFHPWLIVNQARTRADFDVGPTVAAAWRKFFGLELGYLGAVGALVNPVFATTLLLIVIVVALNLTAIQLRNRIRRKYQTGAF